MILDRQQLFDTAGGHAQQGGDPHPEHRARPSQIEGHGDPSNAAGADGGGQRGGQSLERGDAGPCSAARRAEQASRCGGPPQTKAAQGKAAGAYSQNHTGEKK